MTLKVSHLALAAAMGLTFAANPALAQENATPESAAQDSASQDNLADDLHNRQTDYQGNIIVSAEGLEQLDVLAGTSVVEAVEIQRNLNGQIGEVLAKIPGVSASSFSPGASRPVLRGFQGERVRVLVDGLGTSDVSNTSADHATTIDPLTAERIEVLRGPAVLLYGSQAIGGAVNVIDKRIPRRVPDEGFHLDALAAFDSVNDQANLGASLDVPVSSNFVVHFDGTYRDSGDLEIGGFQLVPALRDDLLADAEVEEGEGNLEEAGELRDAALQRGFVPNTAAQTYTLNTGASVILGDSVFGVSIGYYDSDYGVPERPGVGHAHGDGAAEESAEEGAVTIGLQQTRYDFLGDIDLGDGFFERLKVRAGYSDYTHTEFEGADVGTVFDTQSLEGRVELVQSRTGPTRGSVGLQYTYRDFAALGEEAFVPPNTTEQVALFGLQEYGSGPVQIEAAGRYESVDTRANTLGLARSFDTFSGALGLVFEDEELLRAGVNLSRVERAPSAEELFANGPHIATQAFELGNPDLAVESAWGLEGFVRGQAGVFDFNLAVYQQWFSNYIYLLQTGAEEDGLPVFQYFQQDADYFGFEGEVTFPLAEFGDYELNGDLRATYIKADLQDGRSVPRIPPLETLAALELESPAFDVRGEVQWFAKQDRVASFETETGSFALTNLVFSWRPIDDRDSITVQLAADNIFDVVGRRHASFTKDYVPLAGRNLRASVRMSF